MQKDHLQEISSTKRPSAEMKMSQPSERSPFVWYCQMCLLEKLPHMVIFLHKNYCGIWLLY